MSFLDFLIQKKIISDTDVTEINKVIREKNISTEEAIETKGVTEKVILEAKGEFFQVPTRRVPENSIPFDILKYIPEESAGYYKMAPLAVTDGFLEVGMVDPLSIEAKDALTFITVNENLSYKIFVLTEQNFKQILANYTGLSGQVTEALGELDPDLISVNGESLDDGSESGKTKSRVENETTIIEDAPVTKIVATVLRYAVEGNASDVHIEPMRDRVQVRFRVDGSLTTSLILPAKVQPAVVARIKILSRMKLDEKRKPQDGRFSARIDGRKVDFRVSTFPTYHGEKVVMRILDPDKGVVTLDSLGLSVRYLKMIRDAISRPYGLILVSGPTGSGKSTTLYALLNEIDKEKHNVLSLEDPVEFSIPGVNQSQVRADIGYTFANGLRTTLRQDPDIIMVGEIRDAETAKLAVQASLTGHLVLSTIHTNTSAGIIPRLIDMGVDPYLIPPTLILGIGQRLVRKICPESGKKRTLEGSLREMVTNQFADLPEEFKIEIPESDYMLEIDPTPDCPKGTKGREAVFEMYKMDREIEDIILKNPIESAIHDEARKKGLITMKESAIIKALEHKIPLEEINSL